MQLLTCTQHTSTLVDHTRLAAPYGTAHGERTRLLSQTFHWTDQIRSDQSLNTRNHFQLVLQACCYVFPYSGFYGERAYYFYLLKSNVSFRHYFKPLSSMEPFLKLKLSVLSKVCTFASSQQCISYCILLT